MRVWIFWVWGWLGGWGWGGVGCERSLWLQPHSTFSCTSTHMSCYAARFLALSHICHATLHVLLHFHTCHATLHVFLHFHTYAMLCCTFSCTSTHTSCHAARSLALPSTHTSCHAAARSFALPHIRRATLHVFLHFHTYAMLRCTFSCTSTHMSCYAARFLALTHIRHATLHVLLHFHTYVVPRCTFSCTSFHTYVMPRCCTFFCTSTHTSLSCCAAPCSLGLPHIRHATSQSSLLCWWLQSLERSLQTTSARKRLKWQNVAHNRGEFVKHLGRKPTKKSSSLAGTQTLDKQWGKKMEVLVCCSLAQERKRQCPEQLCDLKENRNFSAKPSTNKTLFLCL